MQRKMTEEEVAITNEEHLVSNTNDIAINTRDIVSNTKDIMTNTQDIMDKVQNAEHIITNTKDIITNADAITALIEVVKTVDSGLAILRKEVLRDREARESVAAEYKKALDTETTTRKTLNKVIIGIVAFSLIIVGYLGYQLRNDQTRARNQAITQCHTSNNSREGLRTLVDVDQTIIDESTPPSALMDPQVKMLIDTIRAQLNSARAKFPPIDCTKLK